MLSEKCINPDNNKPYTITMLERALKDVHFSVDLHRNAKQQALDVRQAYCIDLHLNAGKQAQSVRLAIATTLQLLRTLHSLS